MRVAHFIQRYPPALGGSEAYFARLSEYLGGAGDQVYVVTTNALDLDAFWSTHGRLLRPGRTRRAGVEVHRYPLWRCPGQRRGLQLLSSFLRKSHAWQRLTLSCNPISWRMLLDSHRANLECDLVHAAAFPYGWILESAWQLARRRKVPFVVTPFLHLGNPRDVQDPTRQIYLAPAVVSLLAAADRVFVQTEVERAALLERGLPAEKLVLQGMGVNLSECTGGDRQRARAEWGVSEEEIVMGHLANLSQEKGSVDLLDAANLAWQQGKRFRLVLAGPEMPNFRSGGHRYRTHPWVTRLEVLDHQRKLDFLAGIDVFALPSRSDSFGLVLLEAWANGVPNLAYRAGGIGGVVRDGVDGVLVPCGDRRALATAIERLIGDSALRMRLGEAGRLRLTSEFHWEDKLQLVRRIYRELVVAITQA